MGTADSIELYSNELLIVLGTKTIYSEVIFRNIVYQKQMSNILAQ